MKLKVLVIDDERTILQTFKLRLAKWGYEVLLAAEGSVGLQMLAQQDCHVVITDLRMPGLSGQEIVEKISADYPHIKVVVITGYASVQTAVEAMKAGAYDFLVKPLDFEHVRLILHRIGEQLSLQNENRSLQERIACLSKGIEKGYRFDALLGKSAAMQQIFSMIETVAPLESTVLLHGETGTGKELVARAIHARSARNSRPLLTIDCGLFSETLLESELFGHEKGAFTGAHAAKRGCFELADGGTVFLDEITNASPSMQKKLLRAIQEKTVQRLGGEAPIVVDVRIIAACNQDLLMLVSEGRFRRDLYYRLNVVPIHLPPLRERKEDIPLLVRHYLDYYANQMQRPPLEISSEAMRQLSSHDWPGNVRELVNTIERTLIMTPGTLIQKFHIDPVPESEKPLGYPEVSLDLPLPEQVVALERDYIDRALKTYRGRISDVVKHSGLNPRTLYRKMKLYGLDKKDYR